MKCKDSSNDDKDITGSNSASTPKSVQSEIPKPLVPDSAPITDMQTEYRSVHGEVAQEQITKSEKALTDEIKRSEHIMIKLTSVVAFTGLIGAIIFGLQLCTMKGQLSEMQKTNEIARIQADTAKTQADTAKESLADAKNSSAESSRQANESLATSREFAAAAKKQANASVQSSESGKTLAQAATQSTNIAQKAMIEGTRPHIGIGVNMEALNAGQPLFVEIVFSNGGHSPATNINGVIQHVITDKDRVTEDYKAATPFHLQTVLPSKDGHLSHKSLEPLTAAEVEGVQQEKLHLFIYGRGTYDGVGGTYPIEFNACYVKRNGVFFFAECTVAK